MDISTQIIPKKNLRCEICEKIFSTKGLKSKHVSTVHGEKKTFECNVCSRVYGGQQSLSEHIKDSHKKGKKKHKCDSCEKWFTKSGHLNYHMKTFHEGQRNYNSQRDKLTLPPLFFQIFSNCECYLDKDRSSPVLIISLKIFPKKNL